MSELTRYRIEKIGEVVGEGIIKAIDHFSDSHEEYLHKRRKRRLESGKKYAKKIGLRFNEAIEKEVREILCQKIIEEFNKKNITRQDLARCLHASRSKVSCVLNRKLKGISIAFLVRLLMALGVVIRLEFESS